MERITSRENPKIRAVCKLQTSKSTRQKEGRFCCEGEKLLAEALAAGACVEQIFIDESLAGGMEWAKVAQSYLVPPALMAHMSDVEAPQGVLFVCKKPPVPQGLGKGPWLVLEDVRDPGNLGTALRTAEALGVTPVLTGSCAELYQPKTIRSTMGSIFRLPVRQLKQDELLEQMAAAGVALYAAALTPQARDIRQVDLNAAAVVVGNEARGVSPGLLAQCQGQVMIPIQGAESLNAGVAAALVMWEMGRGRLPMANGQ